MNLQSMLPEGRPRERLHNKGPEALSDSELIALILRTGTLNKNAIELAEILLKRNNLTQLSRASLHELTTIPGIGKAKASQLVACFELSRRILSGPSKEKFKVLNVKDITSRYIPKLSFLSEEHFCVIYLDIRQNIIHEEVLCKGTTTTSIIKPKDIFGNALLYKSSGIIIVHNHPSGDPTPSDEDLLVTKEIMISGQLIGIKLLDHIIIGDNNYLSFKEQNYIE